MNLARMRSFESALLIAIAVVLLVPVILFTVAGFQVAFTLLLAPPAALCLLRAPARLRNIFILCVGAGLLSIAFASVFLAEPFQPRQVFSLLLIMTPPMFFFLGWYLCARYADLNSLLPILGGVSAVFLSLLAIQTIATGSQVRWYVGAEGFTILNVDILGLPLYGSFGVLSLASLFVLQMFISGAAFVASTRRGPQMLYLTGFAAAAFLITGSNSRGIQLVLPYLLAILGGAAWFGRPAIRVKAAILLAVGAVSVTYSEARMIEPLRIVTTARVLLHLPVAPEQKFWDPHATTGSEPGLQGSIAVPASGDGAPVELEQLSTGRESLLQDSLAELALSPIFGNGFASFGRVDPGVGARSVKSQNRTTHIHYLTILWKGGVLFFLPYMALLVAFWMTAVRWVWATKREDLLFLGAGLAFLFTVLAMTWDILLVPSAGALGFFLLGAMTEPRGRTSRVTVGPGRDPQQG